MLVITEAIAEAKDHSNPLCITFLDSSKAFNMVDHTTLLTALYDLSIEPNFWHMYKDMHTDVTSRVRVNSQLSRCVKEGRDIQQGETSIGAFGAKENYS